MRKPPHSKLYLCPQAILSEEERVVCIRFGHDWDIDCMKMDEVLYKMAEKVHVPSCVKWLILVFDSRR